MRPNARGDMPGPGDAFLPDEPELPEVFLDEARELLESEREDDDDPPTEAEVIARAWQLVDAVNADAAEWEADDE